MEGILCYPFMTGREIERGEGRDNTKKVEEREDDVCGVGGGGGGGIDGGGGGGGVLSMGV